MQFAFRWMNCLLMREMNMRCTIRMWDTYLVRRLSDDCGLSLLVSKPMLTWCSLSFSQAEGTNAFSEFHLYVCSAFLVRWSDDLRQKDFQVSSDLIFPSLL